MMNSMIYVIVAASLFVLEFSLTSAGYCNPSSINCGVPCSIQSDCLNGDCWPGRTSQTAVVEVLATAVLPQPTVELHAIFKTIVLMETAGPTNQTVVVEIKPYLEPILVRIQADCQHLSSQI